MHLARSINALALTAALAAGTAAIGVSVAPASAAPQCASNQNIAEVHHRLDGAIDQLNHDDRDYGGHRVAAIGDLTRARTQLVAAERYAERSYRENPACFRAYGPDGGSDVPWGMRAQGGSNRNVWGVRAWVDGLIAQLNRDDRDYGGHKAAAISDLQAAGTQMRDAEQYAFNHRH